MDASTIGILSALFFLAATLYSAVGHAGGSAYLAAMGLVGVEEPIMRPTSLSLNVLAASITTWKFIRAGHFRWSLFWPFAISSAPAAFLASRLPLPGVYYRPIVGLALIAAGYWMFFPPKSRADRPCKPPTLRTALVTGLGIGVVAGLTGTGGGIYLSPIMVLLGWADVRLVSGTSAPIILVNSIAGLAGKLASVGQMPPEIVYWLPAAAAGAGLGSYLGATRLRNENIRRALAVVLWIAAAKLLSMR